MFSGFAGIVFAAIRLSSGLTALTAFDNLGRYMH